MNAEGDGVAREASIARLPGVVKPQIETGLRLRSKRLTGPVLYMGRKREKIDPSQPLPNARQEAFCQLLTGVPSMSASEACRKAGYTPTASDVKAAQLLVNPSVSARVARLKEANAKAASIQREELLDILAGIARSEQARDTDRIAACAQISKQCGWNAPVKMEMPEDGDAVPAMVVFRDIAGRNKPKQP